MTDRIGIFTAVLAAAEAKVAAEFAARAKATFKYRRMLATPSKAERKARLQRAEKVAA